MVFARKGRGSQAKQRIAALVKDADYYVRVDAFNEGGITKGEVIHLGK
jgi:hypothetical protein